MSIRKALKRSTPRMTRVLLARMRIQKFDDGILAKIDVEALHLDVNLARCKPPLGFYPSEFGDHVRR